LEVLAEYGFALAGGYALQAHHLVERMSEDIDMFTDRWDPHSFAAAVNAVSEAFRQHGLGVEVTRQAETFARLQIIDHTSGREASMDLAADYRQHQPIVLSVGPVLEETDAVATKVATVFSRALARDYLDLAGILASGRYSKERLLELAVTVDAGFTKARFAEALAAIDRFADQDFTRYEVGADRLEQVRQTIRAWSRELTDDLPPGEAQQTMSPATDRPGPGPRVVPPSASQWRRAQLSRRYGSWPASPNFGLEQPSQGPDIGL
jgi:predicted nucleotidyltransferase component of viral defense system